MTRIRKMQRFDFADIKNVPDGLEGVAILNNGDVALINDSDFDITGEKTQIVVRCGNAIEAG